MKPVLRRHALRCAALMVSSVLAVAGPSAAEMIITAQPRPGYAPAALHREDVMLYVGKNRVRVTGLTKLEGGNAGMQLFLLLDDSTNSSSLSTHFGELRDFIQSLPPATEIGIGYMRNGGFSLVQAFTTDHARAAASLRLPAAIPGINGSPYFSISYLVRHWPSDEPSGRRAVLTLTDGVDRYYTSLQMDDPYVEEAVSDAQKKGIGVYSIYLKGAGRYGHGGWTRNVSQSRLIQLSEQTGGVAYFEGMRDPVAIEPFLGDVKTRLDNQYRIRFEASARGLQPVKVTTEVPGVTLTGQQRIAFE